MSAGSRSKRASFNITRLFGSSKKSGNGSPGRAASPLTKKEPVPAEACIRSPAEPLSAVGQPLYVGSLSDPVLELLERNGVSADEFNDAAKASILCNALHFLKLAMVPYSLPHTGARPELSAEVLAELFAPGAAYLEGCRVGDLLGKGGFGEVHLASKGESQAAVSIKFLVHSKGHVRTNIREALLLSRLKHPNIVKYLASGITEFRFEGDPEASPALWIATEYLEGETLRDARLKNTKFREPHLAYVAKCLLRALSVLHKEGIAHLDLKTDNVMLTIRGSIKLIDFGLAEDVSSPISCISGTPCYIAPEIVTLQPFTTAPDIWSLGMLLLELLYATGLNNLLGTDLAALIRVAIRGIPLDLSFDVSPKFKPSSEMRDFLALCLAFHQDDRPSADSLLTHPWISRACARDDIRQAVDKLFVRQSLKDMGIGV